MNRYPAVCCCSPDPRLSACIFSSQVREPVDRPQKVQSAGGALFLRRGVAFPIVHNLCDVPQLLFSATTATLNALACVVPFSSM
eukprot:jgi/Botrbrau1/6876/Bobra.152_2s0032.1